MRELHLKFALPSDVTDTACGSCRYQHDSWKATGCELFRVTLKKSNGKLQRSSGCRAAEASNAPVVAPVSDQGDVCVETARAQGWSLKSAARVRAATAPAASRMESSHE